MTLKHNPQIHISGTPELLAQSAAKTLITMARQAITLHGYCSLVLSGGETPRRVYQLLGTEPLIKELDWSRMHIFFGDERIVPPDDVQSNYGMVRRELLLHVPIPEENIHRIHGELSAGDAARIYAGEIERYFKTRDPHFDIVLLGVGTDGHTASLFPDSEALNEKQKIAVGIFVPGLESWRVTLALPVINRARTVVFLVEGQRKASIVERIFSSVLPSPDIPATMVRPLDGSVEWFLDAEAASLLHNGES